MMSKIFNNFSKLALIGIEDRKARISTVLTFIKQNLLSLFKPASWSLNELFNICPPGGVKKFAKYDWNTSFGSEGG